MHRIIYFNIYKLRSVASILQCIVNLIHTFFYFILPGGSSKNLIYLASIFGSLFLVLLIILAVICIIQHKRYQSILPISDPEVRESYVNYLTNNSVRGKLWRQKRIDSKNNSRPAPANDLSTPENKVSWSYSKCKYNAFYLGNVVICCIFFFFFFYNSVYCFRNNTV